jgi:pilus assembly protein CpaE
MDDSKIKTAVVSGHRGFRDTVSRLLRDFPELLVAVADVTTPMCKLDGESLELLHERDPELVLADFDGDPASSLRYIRLLSDARPSRVFLGTGPELPPQLLMDAMRAGVSEYLPQPVEPRDLEDALRRLARKLGRGPGSGAPGGGRIVAFTGAKGGTGVTTTAVNAAVHAQLLAGRRTLLLDLDLESGAAGVLTSVAPRYSVLDLLDNLHRLDDSLLASLVTEHESGLHVLPSPLDPSDKREVKADQLRTVLRLLKHHYQLVLVDLGRPISPMGRVVLEQADELYLVLNADLPSLRNAKRILPHIRSALEGRDAPLKVVLNRVSPGGEITDADVRTALQVPVAFSLRLDDDHVLRSVNVGRPVVMNGSRSRYGQDVKGLGLSIARSVSPGAGEPRGGGLFTRLTAGLSGRKGGRA